MLYTKAYFAKKRVLEEAAAVRRAKAKAYSASLRQQHRRRFSQAEKVEASRVKAEKVEMARTDAEQMELARVGVEQLNAEPVTPKVCRSETSYVQAILHYAAHCYLDVDFRVDRLSAKTDFRLNVKARMAAEYG